MSGGVELDLARLRETGARLETVRAEFENASAHARGLADAVGHDSVAQLRESEALWRSPVTDLAADAPLYRLYGDGSGQIGGSFGSVRPTTLDFPHNSLGLPANNSMKRMATFQIDDMGGLVNQRHALPYEGTLGGAPEYVFPGGNGVSVVDDVPFTVP